MVSCSTNSSEDECEESQKTTKVKYGTETAQKLKNFNDSFISTGSGSIDTSLIRTRGMGNTRRIAKVDISAAIKTYNYFNRLFGGYLGQSKEGQIAILSAAALCGGGASYCAYKISKGGCAYATTMDNYYSTLKNDKDLSDLMGNFSTECIATYPNEKDSSNILSIDVCENVGKLHNALLGLLETKELYKITRATPSITKNISEDDEIKININKLKQQHSYSIALISDADILNARNEIEFDMPTYYESNMYMNIIEQFEEEDILTHNSGEVLALFFDVLYNGVEDKASLNIVVSQYENCVISSSELSAQEKNLLLVGLGTARYSCSYWYDKGLN